MSSVSGSGQPINHQPFKAVIAERILPNYKDDGSDSFLKARSKSQSVIFRIVFVASGWLISSPDWGARLGLDHSLRARYPASARSEACAGSRNRFTAGKHSPPV